jgi:hypothetical protein
MPCRHQRIPTVVALSEKRQAASGRWHELRDGVAICRPASSITPLRKFLRKSTLLERLHFTAGQDQVRSHLTESILRGDCGSNGIGQLLPMAGREEAPRLGPIGEKSALDKHRRNRGSCGV